MFLLLLKIFLTGYDEFCCQAAPHRCHLALLNLLKALPVSRFYCLHTETEMGRLMDLGSTTRPTHQLLYRSLGMQFHYEFECHNNVNFVMRFT